MIAFIAPAWTFEFIFHVLWDSGVLPVALFIGFMYLITLIPIGEIEECDAVKRFLEGKDK